MYQKFNLAAMLNHSGNLNSGYDMYLVKDGETWWHCNDKAVVPVNMDDIKISHCLIFFFIRLHIFCDFCVYLQEGLTNHSLILGN